MRRKRGYRRVRIPRGRGIEGIVETVGLLIWLGCGDQGGSLSALSPSTIGYAAKTDAQGKQRDGYTACNCYAGKVVFFHATKGRCAVTGAPEERGGGRFGLERERCDSLEGQ